MRNFRRGWKSSNAKNRKCDKHKNHRLRFEPLEDRRLLAVVINEIHFNASDNTSAEEFVELHNTSNSAIDLSGWSFSDGIDFTFGTNSQLPAGGYVVVAQDLATLQAEFGITAIGQYNGGLSNGGERIALEDAQGGLIDEVEYATSFPWPIASDGEGPSMELVNPLLDNNLGSNWRPTYSDPLFGSLPDEPDSNPGGEGLAHRWSFNGDLLDQVGGADGTLVDPTGLAVFSGGQLDVSDNTGQRSDQSPFASGAYVDLPNGIVSSLGESATFEWWGTVTRNRGWAEIFVFGTSEGGEDQSTGAFTQDYITLIPESGPGDLRLAHRDGASTSESTVDWNQPADTNVEYHFVVVWDGDANMQRLYIDGQLIGSSPTLIDLADMDDNNNWLGRSQWNDPLFDGYHNEFRIYRGALDGAAIANSLAAGSDATLPGPTIDTFGVSATEIVAGQSLVLSWDVEDADSLSISPDVGDVTGQTSVVVSPTITTTYVLTATNANGVSTRTREVVVTPLRATPGATNLSTVANAAPAIEGVTASGGDTSSGIGVVTAEVIDPDGVASVELEYQIVAAGDYLPARLPVPIDDLIADPELDPTANPEYLDPANWVSVLMADDGIGADQTAGDGVYTATIPPQSHRTLVRYRVRVTDSLGASATAPYDDDNSLNFAYFVYDGVPEYRDNNNQVLADSATLDTLPVYHLVTRGEDLAEANAWDVEDQIFQGTEARSAYNWGGTIVYDGVVYDNITYRPRGANGRYFGEGKRSMRYRFNDGYWFQPRNQDGELYTEQWRTLTTGKGFDNHRTLTYGLNEAMSLQLSNMMGLPAPDTHWFQFRVIDDAAEAPDQWNGDFWGINFALEDYDKRFLDAHDLEEGNLYKLVNQSRDALRQQDYQAPNAVSDGSDHDYVEFVMGRASDDIEHRINLEKYFVYHALSEAVRHYDYWATANKNMAYYFEPDYSEENDNLGSLWLLLWDTDASWGPTWNEGHDLVYDALFDNFDSSYADSLIKPAYYNTLRELRDLIWQPDQIVGMLDQLASNLLPLESADRARWQDAPSSAGNYDGLGGAGVTSIDALLDDMYNFAFVGGNWPSGGSGPGGSVQAGGRAAYLDDVLTASGEQAFIPSTPSISHVGDPSMAANELSFQTTAFNDPQGANTFGAVQWRLSQVTPASAGLDPTSRFLDEWTASWDSGALTSFAGTIDPPSSAVLEGESYRARVRMQDDTGRWSHWSEPVEFVAGPTTNDLSGLAFSELHYHPNNPSIVDENEQEYFEVFNAGGSTIDLGGVQVADFASTPYVFQAGESLAPGEYLVVARNPQVFASVYGNGVNVASLGFDPSNLSNGGETISLLSPSGQVLVSFEYDDRAPWPATPDGTGPSLEIIDPLADPSDPANWRASFYASGSPGFDGLPIAGDYDVNGTVEEADRLVWRTSYGASVASTGTGADGNRDGIINAADYSVWRDHLGDSVAWLSQASLAFAGAGTEEASEPSTRKAVTNRLGEDSESDTRQAALMALMLPTADDTNSSSTRRWSSPRRASVWQEPTLLIESPSALNSEASLPLAEETYQRTAHTDPATATAEPEEEEAEEAEAWNDAFALLRFAR